MAALQFVTQILEHDKSQDFENIVHDLEEINKVVEIYLEKC